MKINQLLELLSQYPEDTEILCYDDGDGGYGSTLETPYVYIDENKKLLAFSQYWPTGQDWKLIYNENQPQSN